MMISESKVIDQFVVFQAVVKAMEAGKYKELKQADKLIKNIMQTSEPKRINGGVFRFSLEEAEIIESLYPIE